MKLSLPKFSADRLLETTCWWVSCLLLMIHIFNVLVRCFFRAFPGYFAIVDAMTLLLGIFALAVSTVLLIRKLLLLLRGQKANLPPWELLLLAMLLWAGISTLRADDFALAWYGTAYRSDGYQRYLFYAAFFLCASQLREGARIRSLLWLFGVMLTVLSAISVAQAVSGEQVTLDELTPRYGSTFSNINHFAYLLAIGIPLLAGLAVTEKRLVPRLTALLLFGVNLWALIMNRTMGGFVGVVFGLIGMCVLFPLHAKREYRLGIVLVLFVFAGVSCGTELVTGQLGSNLRSVKQGISVAEVIDPETGAVSKKVEVSGSAGSGRMELWRQAARVYVPERPLFGFGPEGLAERYYDDGFRNDRPHNEYLQHAVFLGIPAAVFYLAALVWLFVFCIKHIRELPESAVVSGIAVISYCVSAFFGNTMYYTSPYFFLVLGLLSGIARQQRNLLCTEASA